MLMLLTSPISDEYLPMAAEDLGGYIKVVIDIERGIEITLNIAVNLGRLTRFAMENKPKRLQQFLVETELYIDQLEAAPKKERFMRTFNSFRSQFETSIKGTAQNPDEVWAEKALTWANILQHRAKLA